MLRIIIPILFFATFSKAHSDDLYLRDLNEIINQEKSISMTVHILERCSGLFAVVGGRVRNSGRSDATELGNRLVDKGTEFGLLAIASANWGNLDYSVDSTMEEAFAIGKIYISIMEDNYRRTGNALGGQIKYDQDVCVDFYNDLLGKVSI